jgi:dTDP-4-dehydrorhamnose reductase
MLGYQIFKTCVNRGTTVHAIVRNKQLLTDRLGSEIADKLSVIDDVKNMAAVEEIIAAQKPDYLINCVGIIKQSSLAEDRYESIAVNAFLPHQLEKLGHRYNFRLIHISTDCVFNGKKGMYTENDLSDASDLYGKTKFLGEVGYGCGITIRTSIIGHELTQQKHGLVDWFLSTTGKVRGYTKAVFSGVTTLELTRVILDIIIARSMASGLYQVAAVPVSKFELLKLVAGIYQKQVEIDPSEEVIVDRSLDASQFYQVTSYRPPNWPEMLQEMHNDFMK